MTKQEDAEKVTTEEDGKEEEKKPTMQFRPVSSDGWEIPDFFQDEKAESDEAPAAEPPLDWPAEKEEEPNADGGAKTEETDSADADAEVDAELLETDDDGEEADDEEEELTEEPGNGVDDVPESAEETPESAPQLDTGDDDQGPPLHRWFVATAFATIIVVLGIILATKAWQPYSCTTTFGPLVELIREQPEELPRWFPSDDCRGEKECIYGLCQSEEIWFRENWVNRMIMTLHGVD